MPRINKHRDTEHDALYQEIHDIANARFEGTITPEQLARLEDLVINDQRARDIYITYICETTAVFKVYADMENIPVNLEQLRESLLSIEFSTFDEHVIFSEPNETKAEHIKLPKLLLLPKTLRKARIDHIHAVVKYTAAAMLLITLLIAIIANNLGTTTPISFTLINSVNASWSDSAGRNIDFKKGDIVQLNDVILRKGTATLKSNRDCLLAIDATEMPAKVKVNEKDQIKLDSGNLMLTAQSDNPTDTLEVLIRETQVLLKHDSKVGLIAQREEDGIELHSFTDKTQVVVAGMPPMTVDMKEGLAIKSTIKHIPFNDSAFEHLNSKVITLKHIGLHHTGERVSPDNHDLYWQIRHESEVDFNQAKVITKNSPSLASLAESPSRWVSTSTTITNNLSGNYHFTTHCQIDDVKQLNNRILTAWYIADNQLMDVYINNKRIPFERSGYNAQVSRNFQAALIPLAYFKNGPNELKFIILNYDVKTNLNPMAFRLEFALD